ncbi:ABC transporter permease subunit [Halomicrobium mukohataei]|uniref:ABC transporter permease subunit n=1 Tax=Halomicrobium mukohataei TaxID=57705 RepID=A0A847UF89_9EURY|nr:ABC transporter permease subunit [Halomicrobium mukohataei]NLV09781.1 ABC transporter permease subunit [Halomicrobium mukohataei]
MSSLTTIARKDFKDSLRTRSIWVIAGAMTILCLSHILAFLSSPIADQHTQPFILAVAQFTLWLPLAAIGIGFKSIVGERTSGSIRILLGQPGTRRSVVYGTYLGRLLILATTVLLALAVMAVVVAFGFGIIGFINVLGGTIALLLFAFAWIGLTVGVSSFVASETRAIGLVMGIYAVVEPLWRNLILRLFAVVFTGTTQTPSQATVFYSLEEPTWYLYVNRLSPAEAFNAARYYIPDLIESIWYGTTISGPHAPNIFGVLVLIGWATIPVFLGYRRFEGADLG